jgi:protein-S-isoprenylcysteine O-methyltransferase Ste14
LFAVVCALWRAVPGDLYHLNGAARPIAYAVQILGVVLTIGSSARLGFLDLAGVDQVRRAAAGIPDAHVPLETRGLYGFVRHPLYFAWVLMFFGTPDMTATRLTFALVTTGYLAIAIPWEERSLVRVFGAEYEDYRRHVRWRMVPGIY